MTSWSAKANTALNLATRKAVVVGGTQGIGAGIALRLAQAGASVQIVGRNRVLADQLILKMEDASPKGTVTPPSFEFLQADLCRVEGMKNAAKDISSAGPVDFLFQCQGRPPTFSYVETPDGIETRFATTILSKFAILKELTDSGTLKHSAVSICAPSTSRTSFDPTDPGLSKAYQKGNFGFLHSALRDSAVMDALTLALKEKHPNLYFWHLFPGIVATHAAANNKMSFPLPQLSSLMNPLIASTIGNSPEGYSEIPVYCGTNPEAQKTLSSPFVNQLCQAREASRWAQDQHTRQVLWETMSKLLSK